METITIKKAVQREAHTDSYLKEKAEEMAQTIYLETHYGEHSKRKTTKKEHDILYTIAYGALLSLNYGETARSVPEVEQGIVETAEFTALIQFKNVTFPENKKYVIDETDRTQLFRVNTYISIYLKLREYIDKERIQAFKNIA